MCGINGIFAYSQEAPLPSERELLATRDHMRARGPDGAGAWWDSTRSLGLGHRRLAIQDVSERGAQPMRSADGQLAVTFNGEIYNYPALRRELEAEGCAFRSTSDTEVLLHLYRRDGEGMVQHLRGMFAFAIWDAPQKKLFLARDPFGIKPLYFSNDGKTFRFASQVKALLAGGAIGTEAEEAGYVGFFILGSVPEPYTLYRHIRALPAGCTMVVDEAGARPAEVYFRPQDQFEAAAAAGAQERLSANELQQAVRDSVQAHLLADVPVGVFLSAGIDSTVIAALASEASDVQLSALTLGFAEYEGSANDEAPLAQQTAQRLGMPHRTSRITQGDFHALHTDLLHAMDQPSIDGLNTYLVSRAAAQQGMKVALSGVGGDELFGGYPSFTQVPRAVRALRWARHLKAGGRITRQVLQRFARQLPSPKHAGLLEYGHSIGGAYLLRRGLYMPWELETLLDPRTVKAGLGQLNLLPALQGSAGQLHPAHAQVAALELNAYMRNQLLRDTDWAGMAHSLEIRVPLVDSSLFKQLAPAIASSQPPSKLDLAGTAGQRILEAVRSRPKTGFTTPVSGWLAAQPGVAARGLRPWARSLLAAPPAPGFRVLALVTDAYGSHGGISKFNRDLLGAMAQTPGCAEVVCLPRLVKHPPKGVPERVRFHAEAAGSKARYLWALAQVAGQGPFDLVVIGHINLAAAGAWLARRLGAPSMLMVHGIDAWQPHPHRSVRKALPTIDHVVGVSQTTLDRLNRWAGLAGSRQTVLPNCVDLQHFTPGPKAPDLVAALGIEGRTVLMTFGRLASEERYKGFDEIIDLLPSLLKTRPDIVYLVCGDGPDRARLQAKCEALGVASHVRFAGFVPEDRKVDYYRLADAYVMPSQGEGFGIVFLEAMACGVPAMGSRLDGGREALRDGELGQLVDPRRPEEVYAGVLQTLASPRGRSQGLGYFSEQNFSERAQKLLLETPRPENRLANLPSP